MAELTTEGKNTVLSLSQAQYLSTFNFMGPIASQMVWPRLKSKINGTLLTSLAEWLSMLNSILPGPRGWAFTGTDQ